MVITAPLNTALRAAAMLLFVVVIAACSRTPNTMPTGVGNLGPGGGAPGSQQEFLVSVGDRVFFETDSSSLTAEASATLDKQAAWLNQYQNYRIMIEGHADERGTREYNLALGERRANAAKNYLVSLGIAEGRLRTVSYGKDRPVALESNEAAWARNRRAVTVLMN